MSKDELIDVLCKTDLSAAQINLLKCVRDAGVAGITREDLAEKMRDGNIRSMNGVFLALSRRIGDSGDTDCPEFFNYFEPRYCMRPALWDAIRELPDLRHAIEEMTVEEVYAEYDDDALELEPA